MKSLASIKKIVADEPENNAPLPTPSPTVQGQDIDASLDSLLKEIQAPRAAPVQSVNNPLTRTTAPRPEHQDAPSPSIGETHGPAHSLGNRDNEAALSPQAAMATPQSGSEQPLPSHETAADRLQKATNALSATVAPESGSTGSGTDEQRGERHEPASAQAPSEPSDVAPATAPSGAETSGPMSTLRAIRLRARQAAGLSPRVSADTSEEAAATSAAAKTIVNGHGQDHASETEPPSGQNPEVVPSDAVDQQSKVAAEAPLVQRHEAAAAPPAERHAPDVDVDTSSEAETSGGAKSKDSYSHGSLGEGPPGTGSGLEAAAITAPDEPVPTAAPVPAASNLDIAAGAESAPAKSTVQLTTHRDTQTTSGSALEATVTELLRPMLQAWLDNNMPTIVEKVVREDLARRAGDQDHKPQTPTEAE